MQAAFPPEDPFDLNVLLRTKATLGLDFEIRPSDATKLRELYGGADGDVKKETIRKALSCAHNKAQGFARYPTLAER